MTALAITAPARPTGERVELARYTAAGEDRVVYAQRVLGVVSDYLTIAARHDQIPMSRDVLEAWTDL